ncbi:MAG: phospho-N-acetylmuramoyl-pentapeptide-transferase [Clostridia bacterium]|nr:phospho-N-acetylmuramoyl-pentapeptide-transferase [Clostridia bacterium]
MIDTNFPLYITAFCATLIITVLIERLLIPRLSARAKQPIYEGGPSWHMTKSGTPTMGGLAFLVATNISLLGSALFLFLREEHRGSISLLLCLSYATLNSLIGIIDDATKLRRKRNAGLSAGQKLLCQFLIAALYLFVRSRLIGDDTVLSFSFISIDIGPIYYPLSLIILVGITNCANLTDGIDGLASSVGFAIGMALFYISCALSYEVSFIASAVIGATLGFLLFNMHPAKIFMGDTGSLFLGALLASAAFALSNPLIIVIIGAVYVLEGISVILQVIYFKLTKKRLFKMAPLHHHLERSGWSENRICIVAIIVTFIFSLPAFAFYLP